MERLTERCGSMAELVGKIKPDGTEEYTPCYFPAGFGTDKQVSTQEITDKLGFYEDLEEQGLLAKLPIKRGTFVRVKETGKTGTVNAYTILDDTALVWVSGHKESWSAELGLDDIDILPEAEAKLAELETIRDE